MFGIIKRARLAAWLFTAFFITESYGSIVYATAEFTGKTVGVIDGDTIDVMNSTISERIRIHGVDCPEKKQPFFDKAKQFTSDLVYGKEVRVVVIDTDRYGRTVGRVYLKNGKCLNDELVRAGLAWWYVKYAPNESYLGDIEHKARKEKIGIWSEPTPIPPWKFRKQNMPTHEPAILQN